MTRPKQSPKAVKFHNPIAGSGRGQPQAMLFCRLNLCFTLHWRPATEVLVSIDYQAKKLRRAVGIIFCGMGLCFIEVYASNLAGSGQYRLTKGQAAEGGGIEA